LSLQTLIRGGNVRVKFTDYLLANLTTLFQQQC